MKILLCFFLIICHFSTAFSGDVKPPSILDIETEFGYFNASFWWSIKRLHLHNFGSNDEIKSLKSPIFKAFDYSDSDKEYQAQFKISTVYNENILTSYSVEALFSAVPTAFTFCYKIDEEWKCPVENPFTLESTVIKNKMEFEIKFYLKAEFNNNKKTNTVKKDYPPTLPYHGKVESLRNELLKMFDEDEASKFVIESGGEEITAYKSIMQARSSLFKELLSNGTDRLRITDFQPKVIQKMIEFCNSDLIKNFENEETSLFAIGYDYKIKSLMANIYFAKHIFIFFYCSF
uniref:BTB domain-containing protein n=1 Tax=Panagrolaimus superbus TaxID=310955 RepID=A0A914XQA9_9BILA